MAGIERAISILLITGALAVGCYFEPTFSARSTDGGSDGPIGECQSDNEISAEFVGSGNGCGGWANTNGEASITLTGGRLRITPNPGSSEYGSCKSTVGSVPFTDTGIFVEVPTPIIAASGYQELTLSDGGPGIQIGSGDGFLQFESQYGANVYAAKDWDAATMRWWRLRPDRGASEIVAEYSPNGKAWTELGRRSVEEIPEAGRIELTVGYSSEAADYGEFDNLNVCPP
jgi:hypothetical protein